MAADGHVADREGQEGAEGWVGSWEQEEEEGEGEEGGYGYGGSDDRLDVWLALRSDLNEGYQLLGDFQVGRRWWWLCVRVGGERGQSTTGGGGYGARVLAGSKGSWSGARSK